MDGHCRSDCSRRVRALRAFERAPALVAGNTAACGLRAVASSVAGEVTSRIDMTLGTST